MYLFERFQKVPNLVLALNDKYQDQGAFGQKWIKYQKDKLFISIKM